MPTDLCLSIGSGAISDGSGGALDYTFGESDCDYVEFLVMKMLIMMVSVMMLMTVLVNMTNVVFVMVMEVHVILSL